MRVFSTLLQQLHESFPPLGFSVPNQNYSVLLGWNAETRVYRYGMTDVGCFYFSPVADLCLRLTDAGS